MQLKVNYKVQHTTYRGCMNTFIYVNIKGLNQDLISKKCSIEKSICEDHSDHEDKIYVTGLNYSTFNDDEMIITFKKHIDKASPLLHQSIMDNEELELQFEIYSDNEVKKQIITKKAFIKRIDINVKSLRGYENDFEEISLECNDYNVIDFD